MTKAQIIALQTRIGTTPDGIWGDVSTAACKRHLRALMPTPHPWPTGDESSVIRRFGEPGDEEQLVNLPVIGLGIKYAGQPVRSIRCHRLVADSLLRGYSGSMRAATTSARCAMDRDFPNTLGGSLLTLHPTLTACALTGHALPPCPSRQWRRLRNVAGSQPERSGAAMGCISRRPDKIYGVGKINLSS